jgi:hypothetical protein
MYCIILDVSYNPPSVCCKRWALHASSYSYRSVLLLDHIENLQMESLAKKNEGEVA